MDRTLSCDQAFRWEKKNDFWYGVVKGNVLKIKQVENLITYTTYPQDLGNHFIEGYFRFDDDLPRILSGISKDEFIKDAVARFYGLRIVRQEPWESIASYICSTNKSIPAIKKMISNLCIRFGRSFTFENREYFSFPSAQLLAKTGVSQLLECGLGYRAKYLLKTASVISREGFNLEDLRKLDYLAAYRALISEIDGVKILPGVGPKVADCALLFSLDKLSSFPVDRWVARAVLGFYSQFFYSSSNRRVLATAMKRGHISSSNYRRISSFGRNYFGEYAGYAQEYLFQSERLRERFPSVGSLVSKASIKH
jgi:N-glycosylase/DNA lyase